MLLYPYGFYHVIKIQYYSWQYNTLLRRNFMIITIILYVAMFAINIYWYKLIIVGLLKMLGIIKSKPRKKVIEEGTKEAWIKVRETGRVGSNEWCEKLGDFDL